MTDSQKLHEYIYEIENWVDEFAIAFLSFGIILVFVELFFFQAGNYSFITLGKEIQPWVVMLALMIIGRELWLLNRNLRDYVEVKGE